MAQDDKLLLNKTTPPFQLLPMPKVDYSPYRNSVSIVFLF